MSTPEFISFRTQGSQRDGSMSPKKSNDFRTGCLGQVMTRCQRGWTYPPESNQAISPGKMSSSPGAVVTDLNSPLPTCTWSPGPVAHVFVVRSRSSCSSFINGALIFAGYE